MPYCQNCGEKTEENQELCAKCGITLTSTNKEKPAIKFYVPPDYSDVNTIIPEGDDIIYSALFNVSFVDPKKNHPFPEEFTTHVLFTKKGLAYQLGGNKVNKYLPLYKLNHFYPGTFLIRRGLTNYTFMVYRNAPQESPEEFKMRPWKFYFEFIPIIIEEKKKNKSTKNLNKMEKIKFKILDIMGEEKIEFIKNNDDFEEFTKYYPALHEAALKSVPKLFRHIVRKF